MAGSRLLFPLRFWLPLHLALEQRGRVQLAARPENRPELARGEARLPGARAQHLTGAAPRVPQHVNPLQIQTSRHTLNLEMR